MSTRSAIVRFVDEKNFIGVYHHSDGYPSGVGKTLWQLFHTRYNKNLDLMLKELIDDHPAGWSTIIDVNWDISPGYTERGNRKDGVQIRPQCYCHGDRNEDPAAITPGDEAGAVYIYGFKQENNIISMTILSWNNTWKILKTLDMNSQEPDWKALDER